MVKKGVVRYRIAKNGDAVKVKVKHLAKWNRKTDLKVSKKSALKVHRAYVKVRRAQKALIKEQKAREAEGRVQPAVKKIVNEVVIYGILAKSSNHHNYTIGEIKFYTDKNLDYTDILRSLQKHGIDAVRYKTNERITIASREVEGGVEISEDIDAAIAAGLAGMNFATEEHYLYVKGKLSGRIKTESDRFKEAYFNK